MRYLFFIIATTLLLSCHSKLKEDKQAIIQPLIIKDTVKSFSFLDSIAAKSTLSLQEIKIYTNIDSFYYTGLYSDATFEGDTVFQLRNGGNGAIINYNDGRNCSDKLFLVFPAGATINSDYKEIETDCDRDASSNYFYKQYKLFGDSGLETIKYYVPPDKSENDTGTVSEWERIKYRISQKGLLDTVMIKSYY